MARTRRVRSTSPNRAAGSRAKVVWLSLMGAMTALGGLLLVLNPRGTPHAGGRSMPALAATGTQSQLEPIFTNLRAPLAGSQWQAIMIHHSDTGFGSQSTIAQAHKRAGLVKMGHHFLIGNGAGMSDGEIHVGERWLSQEPGAHAITDTNSAWFNKHAISICLIGDGDQQPFTRQQMARLLQLVDALRTELNIPADRVYLQSDVTQKTTDPGRKFPVQEFREQLSRQ
jgi:N-acetyl-anhydromuramyl-L-alanine amidase AmpD